MNSQLITEVSNFRDEVLDNESNSDIISFNLGDVDFADKEINMDGSILTVPAINTILSSLRVKNTFLKYQDQMTDEQWSQVRANLQMVNSNIEFYGRRSSSNDGSSSSIIKLFQRNEKATINNYSIGFIKFFEMVINALEGTDIDFKLKSATFNERTENINMRFLDQSNNISVFKNIDDIWQRGSDINFDLLQYGSAPFFERLVCTNGMVAEKFGFKTNIRNNSFHEDNIQREINKNLIHGNELHTGMLTDACEHLRKCDVSLNEFYEFRDFFECKSGPDDRYNRILVKIFNESPLYKAYGVNMKDQSYKWKCTATSGRNAYDFYNDITWLASHPLEAKIDGDAAIELQIKSAELLFKDTLDLEDLAPKVNLAINKMIDD